MFTKRRFVFVALDRWMTNPSNQCASLPNVFLGKKVANLKHKTKYSPILRRGYRLEYQ